MGEVTNEAPSRCCWRTDVLIDYCESDLEILKDVGRANWAAGRASEVLDEVRDLTRRKWANLSR